MKNINFTRDKVSKEDYIELRLTKTTISCVKALTLIGPLFFLVHGLVDFFLYPMDYEMFRVNSIVTTAVLLILHFLTRMKRDRRFQYMLAYVATLIAALTIETMMMSSVETHARVYVGLNLLVITVLGLVPFNTVWTLVTSASIYMIYLLPHLLFEKINDWAVFVESNIYILATVIIAAIWRIKTQANMIRELELRYAVSEDKNAIENNIKRLKSAFEIFNHIAEEVEKKKGFETSSYMPIEYAKVPVCWEEKNCDKRDCPVYGKKNLRCWQVAGTHCNGEVQGKFARKIGTCKKCDVYLGATKDEISELAETFNNMMHMLESTHLDLMEAHKTAKEISNHKSEFLANMSHEIRTPMNAILGMTSLIQSTELSEEQKDYIETLQKSALDLLTLINDILDFSKIEAGKLSLDIVDFNLRALVEGVADTLAPQASEKGLELACLFQDNVPTLLRGDPTRIHQTLLNFGSNAVKFTKEGEVFICIELVQESDFEAEISISVVDTGVGIPQDKQKIIFDEFTQADGSTTRLYGGTGLGLSISNKLVKMMGGEIGVTSEPGKGSRFWFTASFEKQEKGQYHTIANAHSSVRGLRVLVADDNQTSRNILSKMLENFGCDVDAVSSGPEAIALLKGASGTERSFRLLLLDMMMPGMDGERTTIEIKGTPEIRNVAIVILTTIGGVSEVASMKDNGCEGYLVKPVKQSQLLDTITTILHDRNEAELVLDNHACDGSIDPESAPKNLHILLVEDHPVNQKTATMMLTKAGYKIDIAENGIVAVQMVKEKDYDLVLMDIQMPEMDGYEATKHIRENDGEQRHTKIIAMTAHSLKGDREKCLESGMDDYLSKPIDPTEMFKTIEKWTTGNAFCPGNEDGSKRERQCLTEEEVAREYPDGAPVNMETAMKRFRNDRDFYKEMVGEFLHYVPEQIQIIEDASISKDAEKVTTNAHGIKGAAGNLSALRVHAIAVELEEIGKRGNLTAVAPRIEELKSEVMSLKEFVGGI